MDMFTKLSKEQIDSKINFVKHFIGSKNAADGSVVDANANVTTKNISNLHGEIHKDINIQLNRAMNYDKIKELFGEHLAKEYLRQINNHEIYCHDESNICMPYCMAVSLHPFITNGLKDVGGESKAPKHISSFCGGFVNILLALSGQAAGAIATSEFFIYMDYFARKDYGERYLETHKDEITQHLQHVVYVINQPAVARNSQSVFWNVSILDKYFMKGLFEHFRYPDNSELNYESVDKLQFFFLNWFNKERERTILTFPVVSVSMLSDTKTNTPKDYEFAVKIAEEMERKNSFFIYHSNSVDSLSSCCRLKSMINTNEFAYTLGNIGIMTGSIHVITLNMNRLIQKYHRKWMYEERVGKHSEMLDFISNNIREEIQTIHKYHVAFRQILKGYQSAGLLPVYDAGFITLDKQYSTIGINGLVEGCEYLGLKISNNPDYIRFVSSLLKVISDENKKAKELYKCMFNTEFVPAENLGVKNAKWDKDDDFKVTRDCFNSYFYIVEDDTVNVIDKFILHGDQITKYLDGGSALHLNLQEHLTKEQYLHLMNVAIKTGCSYWTINVLATCCEDCEHIDKDTLLKCPVCGSSNITYATRIIGYLKKISSFSTPRQIETAKRYKHGVTTDELHR